MTEPPPPEARSWTAVFNITMMIVGGIALAWMLRATRWSELRQIVVGVGGWAAVIFGLELASMACDAAALHAFMRPEARMVSYLRVLAAYASGRGINALTPFGALGEATKVSLLMSHAPKRRVLSSLVLQNLAAIYLSVSMILIGTPITLLLVSLPSYVKLVALIGTAVVVPMTIALGVVIHRGAMASAVGALRRLRLISAARAADWRVQLVDVDNHIRELHHERTPGTRTGLLLVVTSRLLSWTSTLLLVRAVGVTITPAIVVAMVSVGVLIQWISNLVPLGLGIADGGTYVLFDLLGASGEYGMFVAMLSRARSVAVAVLGLGAMVVLELEQRLGHARVHRKIDELRASQGEPPRTE